MISLASPLASQNFLEDFESGNLNDWELVSGIANLITTPTVAGNNALRLWNLKTLERPEAILIHQSFKDDFGIYSYYAWGDGPNSEADFYFHYQDKNNFYQISHKPAGTSNPEFVVSKVINGMYTELYRQEAADERGRWIYVQIDRSCNGRMDIGINNNIVVVLNETDILSTGTIGLRAWSEFSFFDRIEFEPSPDPIFEIDAVRCPGQGFAVGSNIYDETGIYQDTISSSGGCDSIIQLNLEIVDTIRVELDTTFCKGAFVMLDDQMINTDGNYSAAYISSEGCDSLVKWNVTESSNFSLGPDRAICDNEQVIISAQEQRTYLWNTGATTSQLTVEEEGLYYVEILDANNCIQSDTLNVVFNCGIELYAANIFTPNDDTIHDTWQPLFNFPPNDYSLSVFDRWGNLVFSSTDPNQSWNGQFENDHVVTGVYYWQIIADAELFTGDVTVMR